MRHYGTCIPNNMASGKSFEDLDLTKDEVKRLGEALKDEKFRKMLAEYAEEISDPENRRKAEEEIAMMENERGMNVQFIHPTPGHVLKTTVDGSTKAFINICQNDKIDKPVAKREKDSSGKTGLMWKIPHSFAPPRDDFDKSNGKCKVFDVVFHPDTYRMASNNERFKKLVEDTAVEGIEKQFTVTLDKKNMRQIKCNFKGQPVATVIREQISDTGHDKDVKPAVDPDSILGKMPYPYDSKTTSEKSKAKESSQAEPTKRKNKENSFNGNDNKFTEPKYTITHRSELDMSEYRNAPDAKVSTRPKEIVIKICLPLLKSAADTSLDIFEKKLILESVSPAAYKLDLNLPFPVNEDEGSAKFDKSKKMLIITLPVIPEKVPIIPFTHRGDGDASIDMNEEEGGNDHELITVLSNTLNHDGNDSDLVSKVEEFKGNETFNEAKVQYNGKMKLPENVKWLRPEYEVSQDNETVSVVLKVQSVEEGSVTLTFPEKHSAMIKFMSIGAGRFPSYYSLLIEFSEGFYLSSDHCNVDVSDNNLVLLLLKDKVCRGLWDFFGIGIDKDGLETQKFLTETNLKRELSALDKAAEKEGGMPVNEEDIPELSVLEMSSEKLTMEIKPKNKKRSLKSLKLRKTEEEEDDEYDDFEPPSSAEIEVIHRQPAPNLHSILKQRTVSESSEDHSLTAELDSPRSAEEDELSSSFNKRRSVSFNSHVDRASYKVSSSVSSMAPALKSKRKRQRRREERMHRGRRNRNNSEGTSGTSGTSSGEEFRQRDSWSDSHSLSEEDGEDVNQRKVTLLHANSDPGPAEASGEKEALESVEIVAESLNRKKDEDVKMSGKVSVIPDSSECLDFRTKSEENEIQGESGDFSKNATKKERLDTQDKNKKMVEEIKGKLEAANISDGKDVKEGSCDSDDDYDDNGNVNKDAIDVEMNKCDMSAKSTSDRNGPGGREMKSDRSESEHGVVREMTDIVNGEKGSEKEDDNKTKQKSDVDTMLSWDDTVVNGNEHRSQCAFTFSNNLMFELDVD